MINEKLMLKNFIDLLEKGHIHDVATNFYFYRPVKKVMGGKLFVVDKRVKYAEKYCKNFISSDLKEFEKVLIEKCYKRIAEIESNEKGYNTNIQKV